MRNLTTNVPEYRPKLDGVARVKRRYMATRDTFPVSRTIVFYVGCLSSLTSAKFVAALRCVSLANLISNVEEYGLVLETARAKRRLRGSRDAFPVSRVFVGCLLYRGVHEQVIGLIIKILLFVIARLYASHVELDFGCPKQLEQNVVYVLTRDIFRSALVQMGANLLVFLVGALRLQFVKLM